MIIINLIDIRQLVCIRFSTVSRCSMKHYTRPARFLQAKRNIFCKIWPAAAYCWKNSRPGTTKRVIAIEPTTTFRSNAPPVVAPARTGISKPGSLAEVVVEEQPASGSLIELARRAIDSSTLAREKTAAYEAQ